MQEQEWSTAQMTPTAALGAPQWPQDQHGMAMQYAGVGDSDQMWGNAGQMQGNECWGVSMDPSQMPQQYPYAQQSHQFQQPMLPQEITQMQSMSVQQSPEVFMPHNSTPTMAMMPEMDMQTLQVQQVQMLTPMHAQHLQMAPSPTSVMSSGSGSPTDIERCMAIVLPGAGQFPCDKDSVAAQLQAMAEAQGIYED